MANFVIFVIFGVLLEMLITGALGMYIAGEKGISTIKGLCIGALFSVFGVIALAFMPQTDENVVKEMHDRKMMDFPEYEKTMEIIVKKK